MGLGDSLSIRYVPSRDYEKALALLLVNPSDLLVAIDMWERPLIVSGAKGGVVVTERIPFSIKTLVIGNPQDVRFLASVVSSLDRVGTFQYSLNGKAPYVFGKLPLRLNHEALLNVLVQMGMNYRKFQGSV